MAAAIKIGTIFAGYRIEGVLGRGGMGVVYLAEQPELGRKVAIKVIAPALASDPDYLERFKRESRLAAAIEHPNAIPIYEAGVADEDTPYLVMRYVEGEDLSSLLRREGRLETRRAAAIVDQIAGALDEAHARGLVHRDIKPANVIVESRRGTEHAYLTDFGLTREMDASSGVTATGRWVGTIDYASPEQIQGKPVDARCDVYALGCVLFTTLTGRLPFEREEDVAKLYAHVSEPPPVPSSIVGGVPEDVDRVITRAMAKDPDFRFPSAGDFGRAAMAAATGVDVAEPEHSVATGEAAPATQPSPGAAPTPTRPAEPLPTEPASTVGAGEPPTAVPPTEPPAEPPPPTRPEQPKPTRAGARMPRLTALVAVLALGAAVAIAVVLLSGGGGGGSSSSSAANGGGGKTQANSGKNGGKKSGGGGGLAKQVDGIKFAEFTGASDFTVNAPKGWQATATEAPLTSPGISLTVLLSPDQTMNVQVLKGEEAPPAQVASTTADQRTAEGATAVSVKSTTVGGKQASLLTYVHDEPAGHGLPDMGPVYVANYFFDDAGFLWRTRAAVETSVKDGKKVSFDLATEMARTLKPTS
jgi:serine/threonine protein kinase